MQPDRAPLPAGRPSEGPSIELVAAFAGLERLQAHRPRGSLAVKVAKLAIEQSAQRTNA